MKTEIWRELYHIVCVVGKRRPRGSRRVPDWLIVLTLLWAAINDSPISWAVQRRHWPLWCQRLIRVAPSSTTMSRRLRRQSVLAFLAAVLQEAQKDLPVSLYRVLDGKPLPIGGCTSDRQAGYGRAAGGKAKGYKLHYLLDLSGRVVAWRIAPMNISEQEMASRLLRDAEDRGYTLADAGFDSNELFGLARLHGGQLVAPRRRPGTGLGKGRDRHDPARLRSLTLTEGPTLFGRALMAKRADIERAFGNLTSFGGGLGPLPAWVRTHRRVHRWVGAKLAINAVRMLLLRQARAA
jgi:hypothetical protein